MWVKKCVEMREMLFKNWKWLFKNINQTAPNTHKVHQWPALIKWGKLE